MRHISAISVHQLALLSRFPVNWRGLFCFWGWVPQVCSPGGCGLLATSPRHSGLGPPGGPLARWVGLVAGLQVGQAFGVFLLLGLGVGDSSPRSLGTHPPRATQALNTGVTFERPYNHCIVTLPENQPLTRYGDHLDSISQLSVQLIPRLSYMSNQVSPMTKPNA